MRNSSNARGFEPRPLGIESRPDALFQPLLEWYDHHHRKLPWRAAPGKTVDPYAVLVSELMLQQTTVATVRDRFERFMARFPDLETLARADLDAVLHAWQGLGYYRRARGLHATARAVVAEHGGRLPRQVALLESLPGIGPYTAAAIASIAFGERVLAVDGNVERVLARLFAVDTPRPEARPELRRIASTLAPVSRPGDCTQSLMELGALICRPKSPQCLICPVRHLCRARHEGRAADLPVKAPKRARGRHFARAYHLRRADGAVLFRRRPEQGLLAGLVELPTSPWPTPHSAAARPAAGGAGAPATVSWRPLAGTVRHVFTHLELEIELSVGRLVDDAALLEPQPIWCRPAAFDRLALPTLTRKLLAHVACDAGHEP